MAFVDSLAANGTTSRAARGQMRAVAVLAAILARRQLPVIAATGGARAGECEMGEAQNRSGQAEACPLSSLLYPEARTYRRSFDHLSPLAQRRRSMLNRSSLLLSNVMS
jgi:hypothetical protein